MLHWLIIILSGHWVLHWSVMYVNNPLGIHLHVWLCVYPALLQPKNKQTKKQKCILYQLRCQKKARKAYAYNGFWKVWLVGNKEKCVMAESCLSLSCQLLLNLKLIIWPVTSQLGEVEWWTLQGLDHVVRWHGPAVISHLTAPSWWKQAGEARPVTGTS